MSLKTKEKVKRICKSTLKGMGWTDSLIAKHLPESKLVRNPYYSCAPQMQLWEEDVVLAIMQTEEFNKDFDKSLKRRKLTRDDFIVKEKTEEEKKAETERWLTYLIESEKRRKEKERILTTAVDSIMKKFYVVYLDEKTLWLKTWEDRREYYNSMLKMMPYNISAETENRWKVNYIRHNLTNYEDLLYDLCDIDLVDEDEDAYKFAYMYFKTQVLSRIKEVYSVYTDTCDEQIEAARKKYFRI